MLRRQLTEPIFLNGFNNRYHAQIDAGWLSIKTMWNGAADYVLDDSRVTVDDRGYLILNDQQPYEITITADHIVESFCIFFPANWAADVWQNYTRPTNKLLEGGTESETVSFYDILHRHDDLVTPIMCALRQSMRQDTPDVMWQTEQLHRLLVAMLTIERQVHVEAAKLPAVRTATRKELYRRLHVGRDFITDNFREPLALEEIAQAAALSPFHFLRSFKQLFGHTPHAFLTERRIQVAQDQLTTTERSITDICHEVGFTSLGSFSTWFQRHTGRSPRQYRQQQRH